MKEVSVPPGMSGAPSASPPVDTTAPGLPPGMKEVETPPGMSGPNPTPVSTPHTLDSSIAKASSKYGIDPSLLRGVGLVETGLGTGGNYDPKTGLDKDGNKGHGPWQLDPASGASGSDLAKAATDPEFAAEYASRMLSRNLTASHGNLRQALAIYNSGSATNQVGLAYADKVMGRMQNLDPMKIDPEVKTRIQWHGNHLKKALSAPDPMKAISHTPELEPLTKAENKKKAQWTWLKGNALEGIGDVLSTPMREEQELAPMLLDPEKYHQALSNDPGKRQALKEFNNVVWHPTKQNQAMAQEKFREALNNRVEKTTGLKELLRTNSELDANIKEKVWKPFIPAATVTAQTANDFIQQSLADPFTLIDFGGDTAGRMMAKSMAGSSAHIAAQAAPYAERMLRGAASTMQGIHAIMPKPVQAAYGHIPGWIAASNKLGKDMFGVRRDLDEAGFTRDGKRIRMAIENKHLAQEVETRGQIQKVADDHSAAASLAVEMHGKATGTSAKRINSAIDILDNPVTLPEERTEILTNLARHVRNTSIDEDTTRLLQGNKKYFVGNIHDLKQINVDVTSQTQKWAQDRPEFMKGAVNVGKRAILYNSLPHGAINEGTLTFMGGGLHAMTHGLAAMVMPVHPKSIQYLKEAGALPQHMIQHFGGKNVITKADDTVLHFNQNVLEHMELGWRVGLMKTLDHELGPAVSEHDKLLRGWLINDKAGDYRNQSAMVHFFQAVGGPFAAFHLGIVPKAFMQTLAANPGRIKEYQRVGADYRKDAKDPTLSDSSPMEEGASFLSNIPAIVKGEAPKYITDTLNDYQDFLDQGHDEEGIAEHWLKLANHYFMPAQTAGAISELAHGTERPGQGKATLQEQLMDSILMTLGKHHNKPQNVKAKTTQYKKDYRGDT